MRLLGGCLFVLVAAAPYIGMLTTSRPRPEPAPATLEVLSIASPHRREVRQEYTRAFNDRRLADGLPPVRLQWLDVGGTSKILKDLESRFVAHPEAPGVDLMFGGGVSPFLQTARRGWLAPLLPPPAALDDVPALCAGSPVYDPEFHWFGVALSGFGIVYNRALATRFALPLPDSWETLALPEYFSWVASGDPRSSGSVHMCYEIILQSSGFEEGWRLITRICANVRSFGEGGGTAPREVAAGQVVAGMVIDQYAHTVISSVGGDALAFALPQGATVISADSIAMLRGAPAPGLAAEFIRFTLSLEGQRVLFQPPGQNGQVSALYRMPVRKSLYDEPGAPAARPYDHAADFVYDMELGGRRWRLVDDLIGVWLIDAHRELTAAWKAVIDNGLRAELVDRLCAPPVSESEMEYLASVWDDPRLRQNTVSAWGQAARRRYRRVRDDARTAPSAGVDPPRSGRSEP